MTRTWMVTARGVAAAAVLLLASACAGSAPEQTSPTAPTDGTFPVTVSHVFGETTVEQAPERIVALGVTDADPVLALGTTPIAVTGYFFYESGLGPWAEELVTGPQPVRIASDAEPDLEQIAALAPDLIIGVTSGIEQSTYDLLSRIAPTIARPAEFEPYTVPREDATRVIATALGRAADGEELIAQAEAAFTEATEAHPEFSGSTGAVVLPFEGRYGAYIPEDSRGRFLAQLGFVPAPGLAPLPAPAGFYTDITSEQAGLLDADVLVMLAGEPAQLEIISQDPVLAQVPVVAQGRMIVTDLDTRGAMTYNSVLSVPFALDRLVPQLADALD